LAKGNRNMKILIIGSGGMLGHITTLYLREIGHDVTDISKYERVDKDTLMLDVLESDVISKEYLSGFDVIINCAAILVGPSEKDKPGAIKLNAWFPHRLESLLENTKTKIIQVSTDGGFTGKNAPYNESFIPDALTFYGKAKVLGELSNTKDLTVRASFVGPCMFENGTGLFHWFVQQKGTIDGYGSVMFNAVTTLEFARFVDKAIREDISGIYHLGAGETISKAEFLRKVQSHFNIDDIKIKDNHETKTDNTVISIRDDIRYDSKSYDEMLNELKKWMFDHKELYSFYKFM